MISYRILAHARRAPTPPWLDQLSLADGVVGLHESGDMHEYVHLARPYDPRPEPDAVWHPVVGGDGWEFCCPRPAALRPELLRRRGADVSTVPEVDRSGRVWPVPLVLQPLPRSASLLREPLGPDWRPAPEAWQSALVGAARWARAQVLEAVPDLAEGAPAGDIGLDLDLAQAAQACAEALCAVTALPVDVVQHLGVLDHVLIGRILLTIAGLGGPVIERMARAVGACDGGAA